MAGDAYEHGPIEWDGLCEPLLLGPPVDPADVDALQRFGWHATAARIAAGVLS